MNPPLAVSLFLMFLLVSSVTFTNFAYAVTEKQSKAIGDILDSDRTKEGKNKELSRGADLLSAKDKGAVFEGEVCDGHGKITVEWELVTPKGTYPVGIFDILIDIYEDGKKVSGIYGVGNWELEITERSKYKSEVLMDNQLKIFYADYYVKFDPKKGKNVTFKLSSSQPYMPKKYALAGEFPLTIKIPKCEIDSVIDDLGPSDAKEKSMIKRDDKADNKLQPKDKPSSPTKPRNDNTKPADPVQIMSDIEELTRETSERLEKEMEKREQEKKAQKSKTTSKKEDEVLTELYTATKWLEYANKMVSDALKQEKSQESKEGLKKAADQAKEIKELNSEIKKEAKASKVSQAELNKAAKEPLDKLKSKKEITPNNKIKEAQKAFDKLGNMLDELGQREGDDLEKLEENIPIPEGMKDLPGLGDSAIKLKVVAKNGAYRGDRCAGATSFSWTLADEKKNPPKTPLYMLLDIWIDNKKTPNTIMLNNFGSKYVYVNEDFSDKEFKKTLNSKIKTTDKIDGTFNLEESISGEDSEYSYTLKIAKIGPEDSGYFYSGTGDAITVKIPVCPKAQFKVIEKDGTIRGDPCDKESTIHIYWKFVDGEKNPAKTPLYALLEGSTNGEKLGGRIVINNINDEVIFTGYKDNPDERFEKNYDSNIKKGIKTKDSFNYSEDVVNSPSEQVLTYKIVKIGPLSSGYTYSGNGDTITVKIPACQKKEPTKNMPDLVVKSTSIQHDGKYFIFNWFFEDIKNHPMIGDMINDHYTLDYVVKVTEGSRKPYEQKVVGTAKQLSVSVLDRGQNLKVANPEKINNPNNGDSALFGNIKGGTELTIKGKSLQPLVITPPKIKSDDQWKYVADVFLIDERAYPREQFIKNPPGICIYDHYTTKSGYAISLDLHAMPDPSPSGCRFGPTHFQNPSGEYATKAQILAWEKVTGISIKADDYD